MISLLIWVLGIFLGFSIRELLLSKRPRSRHKLLPSNGVKNFGESHYRRVVRRTLHDLEPLFASLKQDQRISDHSELKYYLREVECRMSSLRSLEYGSEKSSQTMSRLKATTLNETALKVFPLGNVLLEMLNVYLPDQYKLPGETRKILQSTRILTAEIAMNSALECLLLNVKKNLKKGEALILTAKHSESNVSLEFINPTSLLGQQSQSGRSLGKKSISRWVQSMSGSITSRVVLDAKQNHQYYTHITLPRHLAVLHDPVRLLNLEQVVLIDDDLLVHKLWAFHFAKLKQRFVSFTTLQDFYDWSSTHPLYQSLVYVDIIGQDSKFISFTDLDRIVNQCPPTAVRITTGLSIEDVYQRYPTLRGVIPVVSKSPPRNEEHDKLLLSQLQPIFPEKPNYLKRRSR